MLSQATRSHEAHAACMTVGLFHVQTENLIRVHLCFLSEKPANHSVVGAPMLLSTCLELLWTALTLYSGPFHPLCFNWQCGQSFMLLSPKWDCLDQDGKKSL